MLNELNKLYLDYNDSDWTNYVSYDKSKYTRNLVYRNELFQMIIMCWPSNFVSPIHDHNDSECLYKILKGELIETVYKKSENKLIEIDKINLKENHVGHINDNHGVHKVFNLKNDFCTSLHLYVPAYHKTDIYHLDSNNNYNIESINLSFD